jgi:hypothetical protein
LDPALVSKRAFDLAGPASPEVEDQDAVLVLEEAEAFERLEVGRVAGRAVDGDEEGLVRL